MRPPREALRSPLSALVASGFLLATLGRAVSSETFLDGVTYASVARNLAEGRGSFWAPYYTEFLWPFREHPPLAFWLQSWAFRALGDRPWVELAWGVAAGAVALALTAGLSTRARGVLDHGGAPPGASLASWPVALLLAMPLWSWCLANNLLENTLQLFTLGATWLAVEALGARRASVRAGLGAAVGLATFAAVLTKGPPGLFPLAVPLCAWAFARGFDLRRVATVTATATLALVGFGLACQWLSAGAAGDFLADYATHQLRTSALGEKELAPSRAFLAQVAALEALGPLALLAAARATLGPAPSEPADRQAGAFFLAVAACASAPFLLFPKQMEWYLAPALPFAALGLGARYRALGVRLAAWVGGSRRRERGAWMVASVVACAALACAFLFPGRVQLGAKPLLAATAARLLGAPPPDEGTSDYTWRNFHRDVLARGVDLPAGLQVSYCARNSSWRLVAYMQRHYRASLLPGNGAHHLLIEQGTGEPCYLRSDCRPLQSPPAERFALYACSSGGHARSAFGGSASPQ